MADDNISDPKDDDPRDPYIALGLDNHIAASGPSPERTRQRARARGVQNPLILRRQRPDSSGPIDAILLDRAFREESAARTPELSRMVELFVVGDLDTLAAHDGPILTNRDTCLQTMPDYERLALVARVGNRYLSLANAKTDHSPK